MGTDLYTTYCAILFLNIPYVDFSQEADQLLYSFARDSRDSRDSREVRKMIYIYLLLLIGYSNITHAEGYAVDCGRVTDSAYQKYLLSKYKETDVMEALNSCFPGSKNYNQNNYSSTNQPRQPADNYRNIERPSNYSLRSNQGTPANRYGANCISVNGPKKERSNTYCDDINGLCNDIKYVYKISNSCDRDVTFSWSFHDKYGGGRSRNVRPRNSIKISCRAKENGCSGLAEYSSKWR